MVLSKWANCLRHSKFWNESEQIAWDIQNVEMKVSKLLETWTKNSRRQFSKCRPRMEMSKSWRTFHEKAANWASSVWGSPFFKMWWAGFLRAPHKWRPSHTFAPLGPKTDDSYTLSTFLGQARAQKWRPSHIFASLGPKSDDSYTLCEENPLKPGSPQEPAAKPLEFFNVFLWTAAKARPKMPTVAHFWTPGGQKASTQGFLD